MNEPQAVSGDAHFGNARSSHAVASRKHQPLKLDYLWAGLCILGAVYFMFRP